MNVQMEPKRASETSCDVVSLHLMMEMDNFFAGGVLSQMSAIQKTFDWAFKK